MHIFLSFVFALSNAFLSQNNHLHHTYVEVTSTAITNTGLMPPIQRIAQDVSFGVNNTTNVDVGWLTMHLPDNSYSYINVTGMGTFSASLATQPYECAIHGQTFAPNNPTRIIIDAHTSVRVTWTDNIISIDDTETN